MSVAGKRSFAVAVAELRLGCDLVREAHAGPTGTATERQDPLYIWALQHDDHCTRQKLETGWQLETGGTNDLRGQDNGGSIAGLDHPTSNVLGLDNAVEALTASIQESRIDIGKATASGSRTSWALVGGHSGIAEPSAPNSRRFALVHSARAFLALAISSALTTGKGPLEAAAGAAAGAGVGAGACTAGGTVGGETTPAAVVPSAETPRRRHVLLHGGQQP